ncbi:histidine phosphatase family protein [Jannaschia ovalis]|uniref:Histidine phosphatase family protein n=1 Tax=Jannaschia ovalis TaxID=3038773 RepID=A0ABY8LA72_9RHOB|nr:histidine phosphatase family protein [Jannaschia sp. GRR-S6-38]WGH78247.1 histidine phosphatase family protein [Jannaschia sp. GRR-S6-38]
MPEYFILRHGQTEWNLERRLQGTLDSRLTPLGRVQAARQGAILRAHGIAAPVFVSPRGRARATAALAGLSGRIEPRLAEIGLGDWQGLLMAELPAGSGVDWKFAAPGGESRAALEARVASLLEDLPARAILVTHGVLGMALRARLLGGADWDALAEPQGVVIHTRDGVERILR